MHNLLEVRFGLERCKPLLYGLLLLEVPFISFSFHERVNEISVSV